jgi:hypothetical protein
MARSKLALVVVVVTTLALSGCSLGAWISPAGEQGAQSTAEACAVLAAAVSESTPSSLPLSAI